MLGMRRDRVVTPDGVLHLCLVKSAVACLRAFTCLPPLAFWLQSDHDVLREHRRDMVAWPVLDLEPLLTASNLVKDLQQALRFLQSWIIPSSIPHLGSSNNGTHTLLAANDILQRKCALLLGYVQQQAGQTQQAAPLQQQVAHLQQQRTAAASRAPDASEVDGLLARFVMSLQAGHCMRAECRVDYRVPSGADFDAPVPAGWQTQQAAENGQQSAYCPQETIAATCHRLAAWPDDKAPGS